MPQMGLQAEARVLGWAMRPQTWSSDKSPQPGSSGGCIPNACQKVCNFELLQNVRDKSTMGSPGLGWLSDFRAAPSAALSLGCNNTPGTALLNRNSVGLPALLWGQHSPPGTVPCPQPCCHVWWGERPSRLLPRAPSSGMDQSGMEWQRDGWQQARLPFVSPRPEVRQGLCVVTAAIPGTHSRTRGQHSPRKGPQVIPHVTPHWTVSQA